MGTEKGRTAGLGTESHRASLRNELTWTSPAPIPQGTWGVLNSHGGYWEHSSAATECIRGQTQTLNTLRVLKDVALPPRGVLGGQAPQPHLLPLELLAFAQELNEQTCAL